MNRNILIKTLAVLLLPATLILTARGDLAWFNSLPVYNENGIGPGNELIGGWFGTNFVPSNSPMIQLMIDVDGDGPETPLAIGNGDNPADDDLVVGSSWMGAGIGDSTNQMIGLNFGDTLDPTNPSPFDDVDGGIYYVRIWNMPSPDAGALPDFGWNSTHGNASDSIPTNSGTFYGISPLTYTNPTDPAEEPPQFDGNYDWTASGSFFTDTPLVIPEAGTLTSLIACAALLLVQRRKRLNDA